MKKLTKILGVAAILATTASAGNLTLGVEKGLVDKQDVTVASVSKSFNYLTLSASVSNKTYKDFSASVNLFSVPVKNIAKIGVSGVYGYEIFNGRTTETTTQQNKDQEITNTKNLDKKRHQLYLGVAGTYITSKNSILYNEIDVGTKAVVLKLGMQHYFTKNISAGAEFSKRWSYDNNYDNTNNVLFNISYTF